MKSFFKLEVSSVNFTLNTSLSTLYIDSVRFFSFAILLKLMMA